MATPTSHPNIEQHPDIIEMRARSELGAASSPVQAAEALAVVTGLYLAVSPWVAGFNRFNTLAINDLVTGIAFAVLMAGFGSAYERTHAMAWGAALIGLWTIVTPWAVAGNVHTNRTIISQCVTGGVATLLALTVSGMSRMGRSRMRSSRRMGN